MRLLVDSHVVDPASLRPGSASRACFLKISGIFKDRETGTGNCGGALYELTEIETSGGDIGTGSSAGSAMAFFAVKSAAAKSRTAPKDTFMPDAPSGYFFNRITPPGEEIHLDIEYVAGRYYPLPLHLYNKDVLDKAMEGLAESESDVMGLSEEPLESYLDENARAVILAGLVPACRAYMKVVSPHSSLVQSEIAYPYFHSATPGTSSASRPSAKPRRTRTCVPSPRLLTQPLTFPR